MTFWTSWTNPARISDWLVGRVARLPARVQTKLLAAFLTIAGLLIVLGAVGIQVLNGVNGRTEDLIKLQRKIAAYNQVQHDTTNQLYSISTALLLQDDYMLDAALRQLNQFGYDLDRMEFVAQDEAEILAEVRKDYDRFTVSVIRAVEMIRGGRTAEAREVQRSEIVPLADRLERQTNQLVNIAEADMVAAIDATSRTYQASRIIVIAFALGSLALAMGLGYVISLSLLKPVREIETRLRRIAAGEFGQRVEVANRDELGELASNVNQTSEKLGKLYDEIETQRRGLSESLQQQTATAEVLKAISRSTFDLRAVLGALVESAAALSNSNHAAIFLRNGEMLRGAAFFGARREEEEAALDRLLPIDRKTISGRVMLSGRTEFIGDIRADPEYDYAPVQVSSDARALMAVPLLRQGKVEGVFSVARPVPVSFTDRQAELVQTFADQAVIAIENVRLFEEVEARTRDLSESLQQQTATAEVLKVISRSAFDLQAVLDTLAESAANLCEADIVLIHRYTPGEFKIAASFGASAEAMQFLSTLRQQPGRGSVASRVLLERKTVHVPDFEADPDYTFVEGPRTLGIRALLGVPLLREGSLIGMLMLQRKAPGPFGPKLIELSESFADQAVIAIENVRLFEEVQQRNRELTATSDVLRVISRSPTDVQPVFDAIAESAAKLCNAEYSFVYRFDGSRIHFMAQHGMQQDAVDSLQRMFPMAPGRDSAGARAILSGAVENIPNVREDHDYALGDHAKMLNTGSVVAVPMLRDGTPIGAIALDRTETGYFPERQVELLKTFADQAVIAIENVRLFKEVEARTEDLSESLRQQTATAEVLKSISNSAFDLDTVLHTLLNSAAELCRAPHGIITLRDGETYRIAQRVGFSQAFYDYVQAHPFVAGRGSVTGRAILTKAVVHAPDVLEDQEYTYGEGQKVGLYRTLLGVPLMRDGEVKGVFALGRANVLPFSQREIELVKTFADQAVIAIENARLFEEVQTRNRELLEALEQQTATGNILRAIAASPTDIQPVLDAVAESAAKLCDAYDGAILLKDGDSLRWKSHYGPIPIDFAAWPISRNWVTGRAVLDAKPVHVHDLSREADEYPEGQQMAVRLGHRTMLAVPLLREDDPIGALAIRRIEVRPFSTKQIELLTTFADQAVIAIENVRLFEEVQARTRELQESLEYQTATGEVLKTISRSTFDLETVLTALVTSAGQLCDARYGGIYLRDGDKLLGRAAIGHNAEDDEELKTIPVEVYEGSIAGRVVLTGQLQLIPDILEDSRYDHSRFAKYGNFRALMGVPLLKNGRVDGVFFLGRPEPGAFTKRQTELVQTFADQAVIAIENVRLFEEVQARTREATEALEYQTATSNVLGVISRSPTDVQPVFDMIAQSAAQLCEAQFCFVYRYDGKLLHFAAHHGITEESLEIVRKTFPVEPTRGSAAERAILYLDVAQIPDLTLDKEFAHRAAAAFSGLRSAVAVPMLRDGQPIGCIAVGRAETGLLPAKQVDLLKTFADQAVIAIENARLFEEVQARTSELQESLEYQTATSEILNVISRSPTDLQPVMDVVAENAARVCGADDAMIFRVDGDVLRPVSSHGYVQRSAHIRATGLPITRGTVSGRSVVDRRTVHVEDLAAELDSEFPDSRPFQREAGLRTMLATPLLREGVPLGNILIQRTEIKPFSSKQIALLETFADQAVIAIENVRLFEEVQARTRQLQESLDYQTATSNVLNVISRSPTELQPVLDVIIETAVRLCEADGGTIARKQGEHFIRCGEYNFSPEFSELMRRRPVEMTRATITGRTLVEGKVVHILDAEADPEYTWTEALELERIRTGLGVPLLRDGIAIGVIALVRRTVRPFTEKQIELVTTFADQAVIAIENARLFEEVQARTRDLSDALRQQTATADVLQVISRSTFDLPAVLNTLASSAAKLCNANYGGIFLRDGDKLKVGALHGGKEEDFPLFQPMNPDRSTLSGRVMLSGRVEMIGDVHADPEYDTGWLNQTFVGTRAMMSVPLLRDRKVEGVFTLCRPDPNSFTANHSALVQTFADQAVIAIENVRLFEEVKARTGELARSVGELKALGEVSQAVNSTLDLKTVLETIVAKAVQLSGTDAGAIYVYDKATEIFRLRATYGMSEELIAAITSQTVSLRDAGVGEAARNRAPLQIRDLAQGISSPLHRIVLNAGYRSVLIVPLLRPNKITGALVVRRKTPADFAESTVQLMQTFAAQSVLAIQNARLFREIEEKGHQLEVASRHKSQFLANMSHELRTPLNSVLGFSEMLADGLYGQLPEKAVATLGRIQANGKHLLGLINDVLDLSKIEAGQLQLAIDDYSPGQIVKAAAAAAEPMARAKKLALNLTIAESMPLGRGDERRLTQVLINLAGNAVKFTDHGSVEIAAQARNGSFEFIVRDTGPGIAPEFQSRIFEEFQQVDDSSTRKKGGTGLGLAISKRIVEMHGGTIGVKSAIGAGSEFKVTIPVTASRETEAA